MAFIFIPDDQGNVIPIIKAEPHWTQLWSGGGGGPSNLWGVIQGLDTARRKLLIYSGYYGNYTNNTYEYDVDAGTWTDFGVLGSRPNVAADTGSAYDPVRGVTVAYPNIGGTWEWNGATGLWTNVNGSTPINNPGAETLMWDSNNSRILYQGGGYHNWIWAYDPVTTNWTNLVGDCYNAHDGYGDHLAGMNAACWDSGRGCLVIHGGHYTYYGDQWTDQTWEWWPGVGWRNRTPVSGSPPATSLHTMIYMPNQGKCYLFGGDRAYSGGGPSKDWFYSYQGPPTSAAGPGVWTDLTATTPKPGPRFRHGAVYDPAQDRMLLFYGGDSYPGGFPTDIWQMKIG